MGAFTPLAPLFVNVGANIGPYQAQMAKVGATAKTTAATVGLASKIMVGAVLGIGIAALKMGSDFEKGMANVNTLLGGNSARIKELGVDVKRLAIETGKSLEDLTGGLYQVVSAFGDSAESAGLLEIAAKTGAAGLATTTEALNLISATTKGYGDTSAAAAQKAADLAFETVRLGQTTFPELAASIGRVVPVAAKMGVRVEELYAGFATLTGVTGDAAEVSTQMSGILRAMIKPTTGMTEAIKKTGYASAEAMIAELGLVGSMKEIIATSDGSTVAIGKLFRRAEALTALFALTGGQAEVFTTKLGSMEVATGRQTEAFKIQMDTFEGRLSKLKAKIEVALTDLGEAILPVAEGVLSAVNNINRLFGEIGRVFDSIKQSWDNLPQGLKDVLSGKGLPAGVPGQALLGAVSPLLGGQGLALTMAGKIAPESIASIVAASDAASELNKELYDTSDFFRRVIGGAEKSSGAVRAALSEWDKALERSLEAVEEIVPEVDKLHDRAVLLFRTIEANDGNMAGFTDEILALVDDFKKWNIELPKNISLIIEQAKAIRARNEMLKGGQALLDKELAYLKSLDEEIEGIDWENYFKPLKEGAEDQITEIDWEGALGAGRLDYKFKLFGGDAGDAFIAGFTSSLHNIGDIVKAIFIGIGDEISSILKRSLMGTETMKGFLSESFQKTFLGKFIGASIPVIGQFASQALGQVGSWIIGAFSGPSNEELLKRQGERAGQIFGDAFTSEVADIMAKVAEKLPRAKSGKYDVVAAMFHPDTLAAVLKNITSFGQDVQRELATSIAHGVNYLMDKLGVTHKQAFEQMKSVMEDFMRTALEFGQPLDQVFQNLMEHATNLGVEFADVIGDTFRDMRQELDDLLWSLRDAREQMKGLREERRSARQDIISAQAKLRAQEDRLRYKREPGGPVAVGAEAYEAIQEAIYEATHGLTKAGKEKRYDIITEQERRDILAGVKGEQNKLLADQLMQAENIAKYAEHDLERQKEQIQILRDNRTALRESRGKLELIKNRGGEIVDRLGPGGPIASGLRDVVLAIRGIESHQSGGYIPASGLAYLHAGEAVIPAAAGLPNLRATINIGGVSLRDIIVKTVEDTAYARQSTIVSPAVQTRGA